MKKILAGIVIFMFVVVFFSVTAKAQNTFTGTWRTIADEGPDKGKAKAHIEIFEKNGLYFGKIIKLLLKPQDTLCDKCVGDLKNKPVVGMINMQDMKKSGKLDEELGDEYAGGTIMDPDNGKTYKCKMWVKGDVLTTRGYIGFFYRTGQWFRVK
jgi:uncharacterized protein (DUF2147 family)